MHRYFVTGTDTDVGKTRVSAALALALRERGFDPEIVKLVQTGVREGEPGDAQLAAALAGVRWRELARFTKPADPWAAALAEGTPPVHAEDLARVLESIDGALVAEGAGGLHVPLNRKQTFADFAALAGLRAIVVVGLRLGCINHAQLTADVLAQRGIAVAGAVFCERWEPATGEYREDVRRGLQGKLDVLGIIPFDADARRSIAAGSRIFEALVGTP